MSKANSAENATGLSAVLSNIDTGKLLNNAGAVVAFGATIALGLWLHGQTQKAEYAPLISAADIQGQTDAAQLLTNRKIEYKIDPAGTILVPQEQLGTARIALASAGVPAQPTGGMDAINGEQGFGTSQFIESARYQNALETELARSIKAIGAVREARVHLAIPKPSAFTRDKQPASASVILTIKNGQTLQQDQVRAIVNLVAYSIPNMKPDAVSLVDQNGKLLSDIEANRADEETAKNAERQRRAEAEMVERIKDLLHPVVGQGRVSAKVAVQMDFNQVEEAREVFGQPSKVRSEQLAESGNLAPRPQGVPGAPTNTPDPTNTTQPGGLAGNGSRSETRNYELDRTLIHLKQAQGRIEKITAAVMIDHMPGKPDRRGRPTTRALTEAEMNNIREVVSQALGLDPARGDTVTIVNQPFLPTELPEAQKLPFYEHHLFMPVVRVLASITALLMVLLLIVRPVVNKVVARLTPPAPIVDEVIDRQTPEEIEVQLDEAKIHSLNVRNIQNTAMEDPKRVADALRSILKGKING